MSLLQRVLSIKMVMKIKILKLDNLQPPNGQDSYLIKGLKCFIINVVLLYLLLSVLLLRLMLFQLQLSVWAAKRRKCLTFLSISVFPSHFHLPRFLLIPSSFSARPALLHLSSTFVGCFEFCLDLDCVRAEVAITQAVVIS